MDKVTICALTSGRPELTRQTWHHNLINTGMDFDLFWFDNASSPDDIRTHLKTSQSYRITWMEWSEKNRGIAIALNAMIKAAFARGSKYVMTMANDIKEPKNWLKMRVDAANAIRETAVVAIPVKGSRRYPRNLIDGIIIEEGQVIGNWLITKRAFEKVGLFYTGFGIYGPLDLDYCDRVKEANLKSYYLSDFTAEHLGTDKPWYDAEKKESLNKSWEIYKRRREQYKTGAVHFYFE